MHQHGRQWENGGRLGLNFETLGIIIFSVGHTRIACVQAQVGRARGGGGVVVERAAEPLDKGCVPPYQSTRCAPDSVATFNWSDP